MSQTPHPTPPRPAPPPGAAVAPSQPWGRVDDEGAVYVRTSTGDVKIGEWLAGSPTDGLAYYQRRYASLAVDIDLLEHRLGDAHLPPDEAMSKIGKLREQVDQPQCVGDLDALRTRLDGLVALVDKRRDELDAERVAGRERAKAARQSLVDEAEKLAESTQWKVGGERFRAIVEEWKHLPHVERSVEQDLWKRLSHARGLFEKRRRTWFAERDTKRQEAETVKLKLVKQAEALSGSKDWAPTATAFRNLMAEWKEAGHAPRGVDDELWNRFKAAQDTFFAARSEVFNERDAELNENLKAKVALLTEAEALIPVTDADKARAALRIVQDKWSAIGHVPRNDRDKVEKRLQKVEQTVRDAEQTRWRKTNPEARARATATVDQLTKSIAKLEKEAAAAEQAGKPDAAVKANEAIAARREWLTQAQQALEEFSG
jgi:hypothetical protein